MYPILPTRYTTLPPKRKIEHESQLLLQFPLPNIELYRQFILESDILKKKLLRLLEHGVLKPSSFPCGTHHHSSRREWNLEVVHRQKSFG